MNNGIVERQNEEKSIYYLAAQRQLYNEVKKMDCIGILFSIVLPLGFVGLQFIISDYTYLNTLSYILSIVSMFVSLLGGCYIEDKKKTAAEIQQYFDLYVYQMPWDNKLFGLKRNISNIVAEKAKVLLKNPKEHEQLTNWYTTVAGTVDLKKGISMCQKENYNWDVNLRKRFRRLSITSIILLTVLIFLIGIVNNETVAMLLYRLAFVIPMFQWLGKTVIQLNKDIKNLEELDDLISSSELPSMDKLQEIQSKIYIQRKSCYTITNKFYDRYKNNDEDVAHRTALLDK